MQFGLLVSYPLVLHLAYSRGSSLLAAVALGLLLFGILYRPVIHGNKLTLVALSLLALILVCSVHWGFALWLAKMPALLFPAILLVVFGSSLLPGREALVTAIGENARGPLSASMRRYTRFITQLWTLIFFIIIVCSLLVALSGSNSLWSLLTNVVIYPAVGVIFVGEFYLRKHLFPDHDHPGFIEYLKIVTSAGIVRQSK